MRIALRALPSKSDVWVCEGSRGEAIALALVRRLADTRSRITAVPPQKNIATSSLGDWHRRVLSLLTSFAVTLGQMPVQDLQDLSKAHKLGLVAMFHGVGGAEEEGTLGVC